MVSIIIPHFNRSVLLREALQSVLEQTIDSWEIIIVDDGSIQVEWEIIKAYEAVDRRIKAYQRHSMHKGPSACRNEGVAVSKYPYLIFLDSDDLLKSFCLKQRLSVMEENKELNMAVFLEENFNEVPGDLNTFFNLDMPFDYLVPAFIENNNPWQTMAPIWRKDFFVKLGGFDESLMYMEDPELHIRALTAEDARLKVCYDLPADCYYRINFIDETKKEFWYNSIKYRIMFYEILVTKHPEFLKNKMSAHLKMGVDSIAKKFLYHRVNQYPDLLKEYIKMLQFTLILTRYNIISKHLVMKAGNFNWKFARLFRQKGLFYKLLR